MYGDIVCFSFFFIYIYIYYLNVSFFPLFIIIKYRPFTQEQANALCQPNTTQTFFKHIFSCFSNSSVIYKLQDKEFHKTGGFQAYWKTAFEDAAPFRKDLGKKPTQAAVDYNAEAKIRENGNYSPFTNYDDCIDLLARSIMTTFALRGRREVSSMMVISFSYFFIFIYRYISFILMSFLI